MSTLMIHFTLAKHYLSVEENLVETNLDFRERIELRSGAGRAVVKCLRSS